MEGDICRFLYFLQPHGHEFGPGRDTITSMRSVRTMTLTVAGSGDERFAASSDIPLSALRELSCNRHDRERFLAEHWERSARRFRGRRLRGNAGRRECRLTGGLASAANGL